MSGAEGIRRSLVLRRRPVGEPRADDFAVVEDPVPAPGEAESTDPHHPAFDRPLYARADFRARHLCPAGGDRWGDDGRDGGRGAGEQ